MRNEFIEALHRHENDFGFSLSPEKIARLADYFEMIAERNALLHLVAPASPAEFAVRHILESLTMLDFLPANAAFADIGTGAGLPSIPCLIAREDLRGVLIESKVKKTAFLEEVCRMLNLENRAKIINRQFEEIEKPDVRFVACRAIDKFIPKLPKILKWSNGARLLFFGGNSLREEFLKNKIKFEEKLMPLSDRRFLFSTAKIQRFGN